MGVKERWKDYTSDHDYIISDQGRVMSRKRGPLKEITQSRKGSGFWVRISGRDHNVAELVATLFVEKPSEDRVYKIHHKDGDKLNNIYTNLEWV